jgi:hypothetical protein
MTKVQAMALTRMSKAEVADVEIEAAMGMLARTSALCGVDLSDVQRELLTAQAALSRARVSLRGKPATEVQPQPEVRR